MLDGWLVPEVLYLVYYLALCLLVILLDATARCDLTDCYFQGAEQRRNPVRAAETSKYGANKTTDPVRQRI